MSVGSQPEIDEHLTEAQMTDLGHKRVDVFKKRWKIPDDSLKLQAQSSETNGAKPEWWENNIKNHIFEKREIKSTVLRSLYEEYLDEYYGVKEEADLKKVFAKDKERFGGSQEDEEKVFGNYLFSNFSDWMRGSAPAAIAAERKKMESEEEVETYDLKINGEAVSELGPRLRSEFHKFVDIWKSGKVVEFSIAVNSRAIDNIGLIGNGGEQASLPLRTFISVFDGLDEFKIGGDNRIIGFRFGEDGDYIFPATPNPLAEKILSKAVLEGTKLNSNFSVSKIPFDKPPQI